MRSHTDRCDAASPRRKLGYVSNDLLINKGRDLALFVNLDGTRNDQSIDRPSVECVESRIGQDSDPSRGGHRLQRFSNKQDTVARGLIKLSLQQSENLWGACHVEKIDVLEHNYDDKAFDFAHSGTHRPS